MKITTTQRFTKGKCTIPIPTYIGQALMPYSSGQVEAAREAGDNATEALGRLINVLAGKGLLTAEEIVTIAGTVDQEPQLTES